MDLEIAIGAQDMAAQFRELCAAALMSAGGGANERRGPAMIHRIQQHPGPAIAESQPSRRFGKRAADIDLLQQIGSGFGQRGLALPIDPDLAAKASGRWRRSCRLGSLSSARHGLAFGIGQIGGDDDFRRLDDRDRG